MLDSADGGRYAEAMRILRILLALTVTTLTASTGFAARAADAPLLAVLEYSGGLLPKRADIRAQAGTVKSPFADLPLAVWTLREGATFKQEYSPPDRFIKLFHLSGNAQQLLCNLIVHYTRTDKGWRPAYLLLQQSSVIWDGEQFVPRPGMGTREPVQIVSATESTADGYSRGLSFGLASGPVQITAWEVQ